MESTLGDLDFGAIPNKGVERKEWLESPYGKEQLRKRIEICLPQHDFTRQSIYMLRTQAGKLVAKITFGGNSSVLI
ncbi:hypothetical protein COOONC_18253, partial [Cooperia oncophora]